MKVNTVNGSGLTALDVIEIMPRDLKSMEIRESLSKAGALRSTNLNLPSNREYDLSLKIQESQCWGPFPWWLVFHNWRQSLMP